MLFSDLLMLQPKSGLNNFVDFQVRLNIELDLLTQAVALNLH